MTGDRIRVGFLRERRADEAAARPIETFFDLVYVLAVTQLTHYLLEHLSVRGAVETLLLLSIVWLGWIHVIWITNYFHLGTLPVRLMLIALMLTALIMSAVIPEAFDDRGLAFAIAISVILVASSACIFDTWLWIFWACLRMFCRFVIPFTGLLSVSSSYELGRTLTTLASNRSTT